MKRFFNCWFGKKTNHTYTTSDPKPGTTTTSKITLNAYAAPVVIQKKQERDAAEALLAILAVCELAKLIRPSKEVVPAPVITKPTRDLSKNQYYQKAKRKKNLSGTARY